MHPSEIERAGYAAQQIHSAIGKAHFDLSRASAKLAINLVKRWSHSKGNHTKTTLEIRVNGATKLKGYVKNGVFHPTYNQLSAKDIATLQTYLDSLPQPAQKPDDFEVKVDGKTVIQTQNGVLISTAEQAQAEQAKQAFAKLQTPDEPDNELLPHHADAMQPNPLNLELLQQAKAALALLSDQPEGERQWQGNQYSLTEKQDGTLSIHHNSRGEIAKISHGKVSGNATPEDLEKLNRLVTVAQQTYVKPQAPVPEKRLTRGGITP